MQFGDYVRFPGEEYDIELHDQAISVLREEMVNVINHYELSAEKIRWELIRQQTSGIEARHMAYMAYKGGYIDKKQYEEAMKEDQPFHTIAVKITVLN